MTPEQQSTLAEIQAYHALMADSAHAMMTSCKDALNDSALTLEMKKAMRVKHLATWTLHVSFVNSLHAIQQAAVLTIDHTPPCG